MLRFEDKMAQGGLPTLQEVGRFFMREDPVCQSLRRITGKLENLKVPYAVVGGMALVAHGYTRTTVGVDILVTAEGLAKVHEGLDGSGRVPPFKGSRNLRDAETGVRIEFVIAGLYPGDGKPKPVAFPHPGEASVEMDGIRYVRLDRLVEIKLASGMTNPGRLRDLADVQELIRHLKLPEDFSSQLNPFVQEQYRHLWEAVQADDGGSSQAGDTRQLHKSRMLSGVRNPLTRLLRDTNASRRIRKCTRTCECADWVVTPACSVVKGP